jgi:hypothetical protein
VNKLLFKRVQKEELGDEEKQTELHVNLWFSPHYRAEISTLKAVAHVFGAVWHAYDNRAIKLEYVENLKSEGRPVSGTARNPDGFIRLNSILFDRDDLDIATVIFHEMTHLYANTKDLCGYVDQKWDIGRPNSPIKKGDKDNACTYSWLDGKKVPISQIFDERLVANADTYAAYLRLYYLTTVFKPGAKG